MNTHLTALQTWVQGQGLDVAYVSNFTDINYFTGFFSDPEERITGLFVFPDAEPFLFVPALSLEAVKKAGWPYAAFGYQDHEAPYALIADHIKKRAPQATRFGIEKDALSVFQYEALRREFPNASFPADISRFVEQEKLIKTEAELALMVAAGKEADQAFAAGFAALRQGISEQALVAAIEYAMKQQGVMKMSFDTIVQAGLDAADPHGEPLATTVQPGELVLFDLGTNHRGYMSDATRTVAFGGAVQPAVQELYAVCLEAQLAAQDAVRPGLTAAALDQIARDVITKAGYGEYFNHRLGHGIGTSTHEFPSIMAGNDMELVPGMCFSIEPGIYIPGVAGVRIEDCVYVTATGSEAFTHTSKDFTIID